MLVNSKEQVAELRNAIATNAETSYLELHERMTQMQAMDFWAAFKFDRIGHDSISGQPQNLIEQINQMYSNLVVLSAVDDLLDNHPGISFELQLGVSSGYDIQSTDGNIVAECFAVTKVASNSKLEKDCKKLITSNATEKYIYFYSHQDTEERLQKQFVKHPDITFKRVVFSKTLQTSTHS
jgi:hypothetical protein